MADLISSIPIDGDDLASTTATCDVLCDILQYAEEQSTPVMSTKKRRTWNTAVSRAMSASKSAMREWSEAGRPTDGPVWEHRKLAKRDLRRCLRQADAEGRPRIYSDIMNTAHNDNRLFHKLIQQQRKTPSAAATELVVDDVTSHRCGHCPQALDRTLCILSHPY